MLNNCHSIKKKFEGTLATNPVDTPRGEHSKTADRENLKFWAEIFDMWLAALISLLLTEEFGALMALFGDDAPAAQASASVEQLVKDFGECWQAAMGNINSRVAASFAVDAELQQNTLKQAFTQLMLYHSRFDEACKQLGLQSKFRKDLVGTRDLMFEIKKYPQ